MRAVTRCESSCSRQTKMGPIMKGDSLPYQVEKVDLMDDFTHPKTGKWDEECSFVCLHSMAAEAADPRCSA